MSQENILNGKHVNFVTGLAQSRVVQTVFEQMFRETFGYRVYPFGYEYTSPELIDHRKNTGPLSGGFDRIRNQPDFRVYRINEPRNISLVEVKYLSQLEGRFVDDAESLSKVWPGTYIFLATPENFYMDTCDQIAETYGEITPFSESGFIRSLNTLGKQKIKAYHKILREVLGIGEKSLKEPEKYNAHLRTTSRTSLVEK